METITLSMNKEELSRDIIINDTFDQVVIKNYWDAHGKEIPWKDDSGNTNYTFTNAKVVLEKIVSIVHFEYTPDYEFVDYNLTINGKKYEGQITSVTGTKQRLVIKACIGEG